MAVSRKKRARTRSKDALRRAEQRGEDDALKKAQNDALARACEKGDETKKKHAMSCAIATYAIENVARDAEAKGVDVGGKKLDALADVLSACRTGECPAEVQDETEAEYENGRAYEAKILLQGTLRAAKQLGKFRRVSGDELLRLRVEDDARRARRAEQGPVRVGDTDEHMALLGKKQANDLAYKRKLRDRARQGIDRSALPADVVIEPRADGGQLYGVQYNGLEPPPGEERELYETPEEAHAVATRWRKYWDTPRDAVRAAKAASGGAKDVHAVCAGSDVYNVKVSVRCQLRTVRLPRTSSWEYDRDTAVKIRDAFYEAREAKTEKDWYVPQGMINKAKKAKRKARDAKSAAARKKKKP